MPRQLPHTVYSDADDSRESYRLCALVGTPLLVDRASIDIPVNISPTRGRERNNTFNADKVCTDPFFFEFILTLLLPIRSCLQVEVALETSARPRVLVGKSVRMVATVFVRSMNQTRIMLFVDPLLIYNAIFISILN